MKIRHANDDILNFRETIPFDLLLQTYWPADDECSVTASGGTGTTDVITVSDMQVSTTSNTIFCYCHIL
jgi:hypothetical protein